MITENEAASGFKNRTELNEFAEYMAEEVGFDSYREYVEFSNLSDKKTGFDSIDEYIEYLADLSLHSDTENSEAHEEYLDDLARAAGFKDIPEFLDHRVQEVMRNTGETK